MMIEQENIIEETRKYLEEHNAPYYGFWEFLESLKANAPNNIFSDLYSLTIINNTNT
mgnify:CR=1 FL=1